MTTTTDHTGLIDDFDVTAAVASEQVVWIPAELEFLASTFVTPDAPPDCLVTSARCVVTHDNSVLVVTDRDGSRHIVPGGRREPGETLSETAMREVREETGLTVAGLRQVGLVRYLIEGEYVPEVGYIVHRPFWRQGIASEAALAVRDHAFLVHGYPFVVAQIRPINTPSQAVARKLGMRPGKLFLNAGLEHVLWRVDRPANG